MPTEIQNDPSLEQPKPPIHANQTTDDKLDIIIKYLHRIDRRDRIRMWSGTVHSLLTIIPLVLTILSLWYFYTHSSEVMRDMFTGMMPGGGGGGSTSSQSIMDQIQNYLKTQQGQ